MKYYAMIDGERRGPFELEHLAEAGVRPSTYVWCKGMDDWEKAEDVADVCRIFRQRIHNLMHPGSVDALNRVNTPVPVQEVPTEPTSSPTRFDRYMQDQPEIPSIEELDELIDKTQPPHFVAKWMLILAIICFPVTGIAAFSLNSKSKRLWKDANTPETPDDSLLRLSHYYNAAARMWTYISYFLGLILYSFLLRFI